MTDLKKIIADWRENGTNVWDMEGLCLDDIALEGEPEDQALALAASDLAGRVEALETEAARLQALLKAQDAYMAGEPSRPPSSGKSPAPLDGEKTND